MKDSSDNNSVNYIENLYTKMFSNKPVKKIAFSPQISYRQPSVRSTQDRVNYDSQNISEEIDAKNLRYKKVEASLRTTLSHNPEPVLSPCSYDQNTLTLSAGSGRSNN